MGRHGLSSTLIAASGQQGASRRAAIAVVAFVAMMVSPALAGAEERLRTLMEFAGGVLAVSMRDVELPKIRYISAEQMQLDYYGADVVAKKEAKAFSLPVISAYFDDSESALVLNEEVDYALPENEHILVHELVHYLQWQNEMYKDVRCLQQLEEAAYRAQNLWVLATGYGEMTDKRVILLNSGCPRRRPSVRH